MVESLEQIKQEGSYHEIGAKQQPHASAQLAQLVTALFHDRGDAGEAPPVIELCCRNFELSQFLPDLEQHRCIGIDLVKPSCDALDHADCEAIEGDVFSPEIFEGLPVDATEALFVCCRPPAQKTMAQFPGSLRDAKKLVKSYVRSRAARLELPCAAPSALSLTEWYHVFAAAALIDRHPGSVAVIQVPTRILNLARAADDRRLLLELGLLDSVILLPPSIAPECRDSALLCLTDGEARRPLFVYDARAFDDTAAGADQMPRLIDDLRYAHDTDPAADAHWMRPLETDSATCSLFPSTIASAFATTPWAPLGERADVNRGIARGLITKLPEDRDSDTYAPYDLYYLSLTPLISGSIIDAGSVANRNLISLADTYDVGLVPAAEIARLKCLDTKVCNLLIARVGPPFKLALITPGNTQVNPDTASEPGLPDRLIAPSDNLFFAALEDELYARFLLAYLSSKDGQTKLAEIAHGTALVQISPKDLRGMSVPVPPKADQERHAQAYEKKQQAYEDALAACERHAASKAVM